MWRKNSPHLESPIAIKTEVFWAPWQRCVLEVAPVPNGQCWAPPPNLGFQVALIVEPKGASGYTRRKRDVRL